VTRPDSLLGLGSLVMDWTSSGELQAPWRYEKLSPDQVAGVKPTAASLVSVINVRVSSRYRRTSVSVWER
jgi:hypothetical protein